MALPTVNLPQIPDIAVVNTLIQNATRSTTLPLYENMRIVLGADITPDVLAEVQNITNALGSDFTTQIQSIVQALPTLGIDEVLASLDSRATETINQLLTQARQLEEQATQQINEAINQVVAPVNQAVDEVQNQINEAVSVVNNTINDYTNQVRQELNKITEDIRAAIGNRINDALRSDEATSINTTIGQLVKQ
jgi:DNA anti-recombination protein RmuC